MYDAHEEGLLYSTIAWCWWFAHIGTEFLYSTGLSIMIEGYGTG
jgi:hypothetical protein